MAITFAADHETDGVVPAWFVAGAFQKPAELKAAISALVETGMWKTHGDDFLIHDFLDYHPSKKALDRKRQGEAERKRRERESG